MANAYDSAFKAYAGGDLARARSLAEARLRDKPGDQDALFLLGVLDLEGGAMETGARRLEDAAAKKKPKAQLAHRAGRLFFDHKDFQRAARWLRMATELDGAQEASHYWLGNAYRILRQGDRAEKELKAAVALDPGRARAYVALAYLYRERGQLKEAGKTMMALHAKGPKDVEAQEKIAGFLMEIERLDLAEEVLTKLMPKKKEDAPFLLALGQVRQKLGMFHEAGQAFRRAIIKDPNADAGYLGLSVIKKFESATDPDAVILRQGLDNPEVTDDARMCCHFALGKVHDDLGDYRAAFRHYAEANAIRARTSPFNEKAFLTKMTAIKGAFSANYFAERKRLRAGGKTPVFVIGMLRSGTTLVERMLMSHPDIFGAGELNFIPALAEGLGREAAAGLAYPENILGLSPDTLEGAAAFYLKTVADMSKGETYLVDKNPSNFMHLGLIATLFPNAKIIHCKRHPLDTSISLFFQNFAHEDNAYAYDLQAIGLVYKAYRDLMEHWYQVLPLDIFDLDYESLVKFPERVSRRLVDWLGAGWHDEVLDFHDREGKVETASLWQVRQPLYRTSIERWKNYEPELSSLKKAFVKANII